MTSMPVPSSLTCLLHFDNNFNDSGPFNLTVSNINGTSLSTDKYKFGGYAAFFNGGYLKIDDNNLSLNDSNFTIECFVYIPLLSSGTGAHTIFSHRTSDSSSSGILLSINPNTGDLYCFVADNAGNWQIVAQSLGHSIIEEQWHHIALVRDGNNLKAYLNGIEGNTLSISGIIGNSGSFNIGCGSDKINYVPQYGNQDFNGYIDEFRFTKEALYNTNFTPPLTPFISTNSCDNSYIQVIIPSGTLGDNYNAICFRVGGNPYCCDPPTANTFSNTVCKYIPQPPLPPPPPPPDEPQPPPPPGPCVDYEDIGGFNLTISYYPKGHPKYCGNYHRCNRAFFICYINNIELGLVDLNNAGDGGFRSTTLTLPPNITPINNQFKIDLIGHPSLRSVHKGIARITIENTSGQIVYDQCARDDVAIFIPRCLS